MDTKRKEKTISIISYRKMWEKVNICLAKRKRKEYSEYTRYAFCEKRRGIG